MKTKTLSFRKFITYSLAIVCATCAMIAGFFAMGFTKASAQVRNDFHMSSDIDLFFDGGDDLNSQANVYVPNELLSLLKQDAETFQNHNITEGYLVNKTDATWEWYTRLKKTAYVLILREETDLLTYRDEGFDAYNHAFQNYNDNIFVFNKHSSFIDGVPLDSIINGFIPNNVFLTFIFPNTGDTYNFWADIVKVTYSEVGVLSDYNSIYWEITRFNTEITSEVVYTTDNYKTKNVKEEALKRLQNMDGVTNDSIVNDLLTIAGAHIYATDDITINVNYKKIYNDIDSTHIDVKSISEPFIIKGRYAFNESYIKNYMYNVLDGKDVISDFNVVYSDRYYRNNIVYETQSRTYLQAESLTYNFDNKLKVGTITVNYAPFNYSNFFIHVRNNDSSVNELTIDYFTSNAVNNGSKTTITFDFETIDAHISNSLYWIFEVKKESFKISNIPEGINVNLTDSALIIDFDNSYENNLAELSVLVLVEIREDFDVEVTCTYKALNNLLAESNVKTTPFLMKYSDLDGMGNENFSQFEVFSSIYKDVINAISPTVLNGIKFYEYKGIIKHYTDNNTKCNIEVKYKYNTLLKVSDNRNSFSNYICLADKVDLNYTYDELGVTVSNGYRILGVTCGNGVKTTYFNEERPQDTQVVITTDKNEKKILYLTFELTDYWKVKVNYLEQFNDTPFAEYKTVTKEVKVSEYGEIKNITSDKVARIIGKDSLNVLKSTVEKLEVVYNGTSTYTITPKYTYCSLKQMDYNGNVKEVKVPLTCYEDYCKMFGEDWSILWLNNSERTYFTYSNDVARDKLYGYFNVAVFEGQVSDLNYIFQRNTGDGCMTIYTNQKVVGSNLYQFANDMKDSALFCIPGYMLMSFCEVANDNNKILSTYFFYLDTKSDKPYIAQNGADNADDDDSSLDNTVEDVGEKLDENFNKLEDWWENDPFAQFLKICGWVLAGGFVLFLLLKMLNAVK